MKKTLAKAMALALAFGLSFAFTTFASSSEELTPDSDNDAFIPFEQALDSDFEATFTRYMAENVPEIKVSAETCNHIFDNASQGIVAGYSHSICIKQCGSIIFEPILTDSIL